MNFDDLPLTKQMEVVFRTVADELRYLNSGTVFVQIRNDIVGKFGVKHFPVEMKGKRIIREEGGMSEMHLEAFRMLAIGALEHKRKWTHGDILFEFAIQKGVLHANVTFESNYNLASLFGKPNR